MTSLTGSVRKFSNALMFPARKGIAALVKSFGSSAQGLRTLGSSVRSALSSGTLSAASSSSSLVRLIMMEPPRYKEFEELLNSNHASCAVHLANMELFLKQYCVSTPNGADGDLEASLKSNEFKQFVTTSKSQLLNDAQFNFSDEQVLGDCIESLLAKGIYERVHGALVARDRQIRQRFRRMRSIVTPSMLGVESKYICVQVWHEAASKLRQIDHMRTPYSIVSALLSASLCIYNELNAVDRRLGAETAAAADEFIPVLAYILLNAKVKRLATALAMVSSFRADSMLLGEDGYYVVSFLVAFEFLQSREIGSKLVGMTETEFERQMAAIVENEENNNSTGNRRSGTATATDVDDCDDDNDDGQHEWPQLVEQKDLDDFVKL